MKPENLLLAEDIEQATLKIVDFGLSKTMLDESCNDNSRYNSAKEDIFLALEESHDVELINVPEPPGMNYMDCEDEVCIDPVHFESFIIYLCQ